jgi:hypothetical protein
MDLPRDIGRDAANIIFMKNLQGRPPDALEETIL